MRGRNLYIGLLSLISAAILFAGYRLLFYKAPEVAIPLERPAQGEHSRPDHKFSNSVESRERGVWGQSLSPADRAEGELKGKAEIRTNLELLTYMLDKGQEGEFLTKIDQLIAQNPTVAEYVALKADFYYARQNWTAAEESIKKLIQLDPENTFAQSSLGEVQGILGKYDEGLATLSGVLQKEPGNLDALYGTISITDLQGDSSVGIQKVSDLYKANPNNGNLAIVYSDILMSQGRHEERREVLAKAMKSDPENPHPFRIAANDALREGRLEQAMKWAEQSLQYDKNSETRMQSMDLAYRAAMGAEDYNRAEKILEMRKSEAPWDESIALQFEAIKQARAGAQAPASKSAPASAN